MNGWQWKTSCAPDNGHSESHKLLPTCECLQSCLQFIQQVKSRKAGGSKPPSNLWFFGVTPRFESKLLTPTTCSLPCKLKKHILKWRILQS